jgi:hypothetical protein
MTHGPIVGDFNHLDYSAFPCSSSGTGFFSIK